MRDSARTAIMTRGVLAFGPDRKLYVLFGDAGRRSQLQNLQSSDDANRPALQPDDQFGGPQPDDAHFTGVILRLNALMAQLATDMTPSSECRGRARR